MNEDKFSFSNNPFLDGVDNQNTVGNDNVDDDNSMEVDNLMSNHFQLYSGKNDDKMIELAVKRSKESKKVNSKQKKRNLPNILVTGTPGCGKSTLCEQLETYLSQFLGKIRSKSNVALPTNTDFEYVAISQFALQNKFIEEYDKEKETFVLLEDPILDYFEDQRLIDSKGGFILEYHSSDWFPERWFDLVVVLNTDIATLASRLEKRKGYSARKVKENVECEIYQVCLEEASESYEKEIVWSLKSSSIDDIDENCDLIAGFVESFYNERTKSETTSS